MAPVVAPGSSFKHFVGRFAIALVLVLVATAIGVSTGNRFFEDAVEQIPTTHIRDGMWLDVNGTPLTDQATVVERFRRPYFGNLEIDITITDPKAFTKPFTVRVNQRLMVDTDLIEFICNENEQSSKHYEK